MTQARRTKGGIFFHRHPLAISNNSYVFQLFSVSILNPSVSFHTNIQKIQKEKTSHCHFLPLHSASATRNHNHSMIETQSNNQDETAEDVPNENIENTENDNDKKDEGESSAQPPSRRVLDRVMTFYWDNEFVCLVVIVILLARAYPPLGAEYLAPEITSTWIAVIFIFILAGLGLKTKEFSKAFQRLGFNVSVQLFNFGVVSSVVFGVSRGLAEINVISQALADGMVVCSALPLTINMVLVLTKSAGGDEASAIFNAAFGNLCGVFLSPVLILGYLGVSGSVELWEIFYKLALRVVAPVVVGQLLQKFSPPVVDFVNKHKKHFKKAQQYCLVFIVYTVFCRTFADEQTDSDVGDIFIMIAVQFCLLCSLMVLSWYTFRCLFRDEPTLRVMALFGSTHKTVAMGVPLINAIYEEDPLVGLYTLPLLIWHPMQLVIGSFLAPKLAAWVEQEQKRLDRSESSKNENTVPEESMDEENPSSNK